MHIVFLNDDALPSAKGGVAVVVDSHRKGMADRGHTVTLITTHQDRSRSHEERTRDAAGEIISLYVDYPKQLRHRRAVSKTPLSDRIDVLLAALRPDVVHAHNVHNYLTYDVLRVARQHTDRVFLMVHDTFLVSFGRVGGPRYEAAALTGKPYRMRLYEHLKAAGRQYWPLRNWMIRRILRASVRPVIVYTHAMENFLHDNGIVSTSYLPRGTSILPPASDADIRAVHTKYDLHGPTVLYGARISADKGIEALLKVIGPVSKQVPDVHFLIVGDLDRVEPYLRTLDGNVRRHIRTTGWLGYEEYKTLYAVSDVVTTPSLYLDNVPTINLEAMAAARPVVSTCFGGTPELVIDGVTGFVINPRDTDAYADRLLRLLRDPILARKMGDAGKRRIETEFSFAAHIEGLLRLYTA